MRSSGITRSIFILLLSFALTACEEESVQKSSFGEVDVLADGDVLFSPQNFDDEETEGEEEKEEDSATGNTSMKTASSVDLNDIPDSISKMTLLCDAINMACVEQQTAYKADNAGFVWHCVHLYVGNCNDKRMGFKKVGDSVEADPSKVIEVVYAMFGKLGKVPDIPSDLLADPSGGEPHIRISNNLKYRFSLGDRGLSEPVLRRATKYSDGSLEMEVALVDGQTGDETVSFIYSMRANTKNTTTSATFDYEITGARPADKITSDKISGMPFLVPIMQTYGYSSYPEDDPKYNEVLEVFNFNSYQENVPGMEELNVHISREIMEFVNAPTDDASWKEVCSYPLTTDNYVQVATTFITYPTYAEDPDIRCYNYDKKKLRAMEYSDVLALSDFTDNELKDRIKSLWKPESDAETLTGLSYRGFLMRHDASADIFFMINVDNKNAEPYSRLIAYNSKKDEIRYVFESGGVIPRDEEDSFKPELTHGHKEDATEQ